MDRSLAKGALGLHQFDLGNRELDTAVDRFGGESKGFEEGNPFAPGRGLFEPHGGIGILGDRDRDRFSLGRDPDTLHRSMEVREGEGDVVSDRIAGGSSEQVALPSSPDQFCGIAPITVEPCEESSATGDRGRQAESGSEDAHQRPSGGECIGGEASAYRVGRVKVATVPHRDVDR